MRLKLVKKKGKSKKKGRKKRKMTEVFHLQHLQNDARPELVHLWRKPPAAYDCAPCSEMPTPEDCSFAAYLPMMERKRTRQLVDERKKRQVCGWWLHAGLSGVTPQHSQAELVL